MTDHYQYVLAATVAAAAATNVHLRDQEKHDAAIGRLGPVVQMLLHAKIATERSLDHGHDMRET